MTTKVLFVGLGVTGSAFYQLTKKNKDYDVYGIDLDKKQMKKITGSKTMTIESCDILMIHIGYSRVFTKIVSNYAKQYNPKVIIVNSTVVPGVCKTIQDSTGIATLHSPVRGQHDSMLDHIQKYSKWISGINYDGVKLASKFFTDIGLKIRIATDTTTWNTELIKILDTSQYGILIAWAQEAERICRKHNVDHKLVLEFGAETQELLDVRPFITPGFIGGTCVRQNLELINDNCFNSKIITAVLDSNNRFKHSKQITEEY